MASLLNSPILIEPVQKCVPYSNQLDEHKHGKTRYYELQIEQYINTHGVKKKANEAYRYFDIPDLKSIWKSESYFNEKYYEIRSRMKKNIGNAQVTIHTTTIACQ